MMSPMAPFVTRFAPSPTGRLHLGHAFAAFQAHDAANAVGGRFLLRIEDIDQTRVRPAFEAGIYEDLAWLGLNWETPVLRQSQRLPAYRSALEMLQAHGLVYRCFKTRQEVMDEIGRAPHGLEVYGGVYRGEALGRAEEGDRLARGEPFAWRLSLARARALLGGFDELTFVEEGRGPNGERGWITANPELAGDVILARKDVGVAYHLAVVVDDAHQGVTQVVRGHDLFAAAHIQRLLQALLELPTPTYRHHRLLMGADGKRLAKRDGGDTLADLRAAGVTPADVRSRVGM
jgi:glutamyl-Q tRNA(Asp) synthetase